MGDVFLGTNPNDPEAFTMKIEDLSGGDVLVALEDNYTHNLIIRGSNTFGNTENDNGGNLYLLGGDEYTTNSGSGGRGGDVYITGGTTNSASEVGGTVYIFGGDNLGNSNGGNIYISAGDGDNTGSIYIANPINEGGTLPYNSETNQYNVLYDSGSGKLSFKLPIEQVINFNTGVTTVDWTVSEYAYLELTGDVDEIAFNDSNNIGEYILNIKHIGGNWEVIAWDTAIWWPEGIPPVLSNTENDIDHFRFFWNGIVYLGMFVVKFRPSMPA
jgi:hypothetical protein